GGTLHGHGVAHVREAAHTPRESDELSWRSKGIRIKGLGSARPMLFERLVSQALERLLGFGEGGFPALVDGEFLEDGRREFVLLPAGETGRRFERLLQRLCHGWSSRPNGTRRSSGGFHAHRWHLRRTPRLRGRRSRSAEPEVQRAVSHG